jgi:hypothetical protein
MARPYALQPGDVAPDLSDYNFSNEADRRPQETVVENSSAPMHYHGQYPAADQSRPEGGRLWKVGQAQPNEFLSAPYPVIAMNGNGTDTADEVHEVDIYKYGDSYDPTSPMRVRDVGSEWQLDSDFDGRRN